MLRATFQHLSGLGPQEESVLWKVPIRDWAELEPRIDEFVPSTALATRLRRELRASEEALATGAPAWFGARLAPAEHWRIYPEFRSRTAFLDIETTGLSPHNGIVTVVGVHGAGSTRSFIADDNLEELPAYLSRFALLVTFNGSLFDVPFLQYRFPDWNPPSIHLDLRFILRRLGLTGGLKRIEQVLGLGDRSGVEGIHGLEAVWLWERWRRGDADALDRLVRYNRADTVNLEPLTEYAVRELSTRLLSRGLSAAGPAAGAIGPALPTRS